MPLQITARHVDLNHDQRAYIQSRVDRFRKLAVSDRITVLDTIVTGQKGRFEAEVHVKANRFEAAGSVTHPDLYTAIDQVMSKVERQLRRQLDRTLTRKRHSRETRGQRAVTVTLSFPDVEPEPDEQERVIFHTERISTKPISVEEAAEQLEMEADAFLVFNNAETDQINIIYRREDNHFGVIEPT